MNALPQTLTETLTALLKGPILRSISLGGGMINRAARLETAQGAFFVKWRERAPPGFFSAEADGLRRLHAAGALRVPDVIASRDNHAPPFLLLEYLPAASPHEPEAFAHRFGVALATLHREHPAPDGKFGLSRDNYIGVLPQTNTRHDNWTEFYRDCRLLPQIGIARQRGLLHENRERRLEALLERLPSLLADFSAAPVLLHGDLWSGNFLCSGGEPVVFDPAAYYGEREIEIAYVEMFGGFPAGFLRAYRESYPLDPDYEHRRLLHQLYPYLVHLNIFGETYGPDIDRICHAYLAA